MKTLKTITAADLIELLQDLPDDALVAFSSNYSDYGRTEQVHAIRGGAEAVALTETAYSVSGFAVAERHEDDAESKQSVYIIS